MTESSAILKYLASKSELPGVPEGSEEARQVDEAMDWFNTQFYRDFCYGLLYPQIFPNHKRATDEFHNGVDRVGQGQGEGLVRHPRQALHR